MARRAFYGSTRKEAIQKLRDAQNAVGQGVLVPVNKHTVESYLTEWLSTLKNSKRPSTVEYYENYVHRHIVPMLGRTPLARLEARQLERLYADKAASGLSGTTILHIHRTLFRALRMAVRKRYIGRNVVDEVYPPAASGFERKALQPDEAIRLIDACRRERLGVMVVVALTAGLRRGEVLGLHWADVDLDAGTMVVRCSLGSARGQGLLLGQTKTRRSRRSVPLIPYAVEALRGHRSRQREEQLTAGPLWLGTDLVFTNHVGGMLHPSNVNARFFQPLRERVGLTDVRFHDLRHSTASLLFALGVEPKLVQEILGHSNIAITLDTYTHTVSGQHREAMDKLGRLLGG